MQARSEELPCGDCVLSGHAATLVGVLQYELATHSGQSVLEPTLREYLPIAQTRQSPRAVAPVVLRKVPAMQLLGRVVPLMQYCPIGHAAQSPCVTPVVELRYEPAEQFVGLTVVVSGQYLPVGHTKQTVWLALG